MISKKEELGFKHPSMDKPRSKQLEDPIASVQGKTYNTEAEAKVDIVAKTKSNDHNWETVASYGEVKFRGKYAGISDVSKLVRSICEISIDATLVQVRHTEAKIGNLMAEISVEKSLASYAVTQMEYQRIKSVGSVLTDKERRSMTFMEAKLVASDVGHSAINDVLLGAKAALEFWNEMYAICIKTSDRVKAIGMLLMSERRFDPDAGISGHGEKIKGHDRRY